MSRATTFTLALFIGVLTSLTLAYTYTTYIVDANLTETLDKEGFKGIDGVGFGQSFLAVLGVALVYFSAMRDVSEFLAILLTGFWSLASGLQDVFVYVFIGEIPDTLPHLTGTPPGLLASLFNNGVVTPFWLYMNVVVTGVLLALAVYGLWVLEDTYGPVNV